MSSDKKITYTETAAKRIEELHEKLRKQVENELRDRYFVPGADSIEITGSHVDDLARNVRVVFLHGSERRMLTQLLIFQFYFFLGILTLLAGLFYPYFKSLTADPIQTTLILSGILMTVVSLVGYSLQKRRAALLRERELLMRSQSAESDCHRTNVDNFPK